MRRGTNESRKVRERNDGNGRERNAGDTRKGTNESLKVRERNDGNGRERNAGKYAKGYKSETKVERNAKRSETQEEKNAKGMPENIQKARNGHKLSGTEQNIENLSSQLRHTHIQFFTAFTLNFCCGESIF